jgi:hypothetical protein
MPLLDGTGLSAGSAGETLHDMLVHADSADRAWIHHPAEPGAV